ncbi:uncharacterized protein RCC_07630 [Ramularia collo-cygni]|uniref:Uncharacterized protein n=1 Tax=Ramularia collo-cygni TaxID=112498 RepID=A0A2D3V500_9PEZI|nr:uncharacterized protein RCC_07630 [Ramularia collo-cygni]CZT21765.1 uncharacterized protein RCC_07630 [Ramularia collo-cygni]
MAPALRMTHANKVELEIFFYSSIVVELFVFWSTMFSGAL